MKAMLYEEPGGPEVLPGLAVAHVDEIARLGLAAGLGAPTRRG